MRETERTPDAAVDVGSAADPVGAVLDACAGDGVIALRTSGSTSRPRSVLRTAASWADSFPHVSRLAGIDATSHVWVPGPLTATMNLFAAVHARWAGAAIVGTPEDASHAHLTPAALVRCLDEGVSMRGLHVIVAGERLPQQAAKRAAAAGARTSHYYGAAELSFVAWGTSAGDLRAFPGVEVAVRRGTIWARSPYLSCGYAGEQGPLRFGADGFATVGDRGRLAHGVLTVTGRGDGTVVTAGATVLIADVEHTLREASGNEVVVLGIDHPRLGALVVAVLPDRAALPGMRAIARTQLSRSHRPVWWLHGPHLPLTPAGKVDRTALADLVTTGGLTPLALPERPSTDAP